MKTYTLNSSEVELCGAAFDGNDTFYRLPDNVAQKLPDGVRRRNSKPVGARIRFSTCSPEIKITFTLKEQVVDWAIPLSGSAGADVFVGRGKNAKWAGIVAPKSYDTLIGEGIVRKSNQMEDVVINLPRNHAITDIKISVDDKATVRRSSPYKIAVPLVFYGSSITEGGCASSPGNAYTSIVSRWLDADYLNLGYSNAARGEAAVAEYIAGLKMSAFVMDYDHNAYDFELLKSTHEPFFKTIRKANPNLPIIIMTRPDYAPKAAQNQRRIELIKQTYLNAKHKGDENVYFISGDSFFKDYDNGLCTVEGCHPNDLGFMLMAQKVYPVLKQALKVE